VEGVSDPTQFALLESRKRGGVIHSRQLRLILGFRCVPSCELGLRILARQIA